MKNNILEKPILYLIGLTFLWGSSFPIMKIGLSIINSHEIIYFFRFFLATLFILPFFVVENRKKKEHWCSKRNLAFIIATSIIGHFSYYYQIKSLNYLNANYAAFITGLSIVFVPLISLVFLKTKLSKNENISILVGILGLLLISQIGFKSFKIGDFYLIVSTLLFSVHILLMGVAPISKIGYWTFAFFQTLLMSFYQLLVINKSEFYNFSMNLINNINYYQIIIFIILSLIVFFTFYIQSRYQHLVSPIKASLIYASEPVFSLLISYILLNETINTSMAIGGALILISATFTEIKIYFEKKDKYGN